ncbi:9952_t:CDS:1, partial [Funneliformis geosporum]
SVQENKRLQLENNYINSIFDLDEAKKLLKSTQISQQKSQSIANLNDQ